MKPLAAVLLGSTALVLGAGYAVSLSSNETELSLSYLFNANGALNTPCYLVGTIWQGLVTIDGAIDLNAVFGRTSAARATDTVNAFDYGCAAIVNTTTDAAACLSAANAAAKAQGKHKVFVPAGAYNIASAVTGLTAGVQFVGDGWDEGFTNGTRFLRSATGFVPFAYSGAFRGGLIDIAFQDAEPTPSATPGTAWTPKNYGPWMTTAGGSGFIQNVYLYGVTAFAQFTNSHTIGAGRNEIHGLYGQVFNYALDFEISVDSSRVEDFHVWPFWSQNANVYTYNIANTTPIISRRNDNPHFSNVFAFATKTLIWFDSTAAILPGITSKARIANGDCDSCLYSIYITGNGTSVQYANWTSQASPPSSVTADAGGLAIPGSIGAYIPANQAIVGIANWQASQIGLQVLSVTGINNTVNYINGQFLNWGGDGGTVYAMTATAAQGNTVVGYGASFQSPSTGGTNYNSGTYSMLGPGAGAGSTILNPFGEGTAAGASAVAVQNCAAIGPQSLCAAQGGNSSGQWDASFGFATRDITSGQYNAMFGYLTNGRGAQGGVFGSAGPFAVSGDSQWSIRHLRIATTGAASGRLTGNGSAASSTNTFNLPLVKSNGLAYGFSRFAVVAFDKANVQACMWYVDGLLARRSATAGSTALVGTPTISLSQCDSGLGLSAASLAVTADTTNDGINFTVTGTSGHNLHVVAVPQSIELQ